MPQAPQIVGPTRLGRNHNLLPVRGSPASTSSPPGINPLNILSRCQEPSRPNYQLSKRTLRHLGTAICLVVPALILARYRDPCRTANPSCLENLAQLSIFLNSNQWHPSASRMDRLLPSTMLLSFPWHVRILTTQMNNLIQLLFLMNNYFLKTNIFNII